MHTILAPGAPWPSPPVKAPKDSKVVPAIAPKKKKTTIFKEYIATHPGTYPIQLSTALQIDYRATQRTLRQMADKGVLRCEGSAYYPIK